jgi:hypothetical protein
MNGGSAHVGKKQDPFLLILLSIVTCGIYAIYYWYITGQDLNKMLGREAVNPVFLFISLVFFPLMFYYLYMIDKALEEVGGQSGKPYSPNFIMWLLLSLICGIGGFVALFQTSKYLNNVWGY